MPSRPVVAPLSRPEEVGAEGLEPRPVCFSTCAPPPKSIRMANRGFGTAMPRALRCLPGMVLWANLGSTKICPVVWFRVSQFVEYGVVEYRYERQFPDAFASVLRRYPHRRDQKGLDYTASAFIAVALSRLD